jgi:hypothetical protein
MKKSSWFHARFEVMNAILIALVSLTTAFSVWRTNVVGSNAADESRLGLIDAVKNQAFENENYQKVYEEAGFAYEFAVKEAEVQALEEASSADSRDRGANIRQYLLPNMQLLAQPLATDERYLRSDGTYDLQKRLDDKRAENETMVDPSAAFARADRFFAEQRWLVIGSILLAVSLFWLALAEVSSAKLRTVEFAIGLAVYLIGIVWLLGVEVVFFFLGRGAA